MKKVFVGYSSIKSDWSHLELNDVNVKVNFAIQIMQGETTPHDEMFAFLNDLEKFINERNERTFNKGINERVNVLLLKKALKSISNE